MKETIIDIIKAAVKYLIVALLFIIIICFGGIALGKEKFDLAIYILNTITINESNVKTITPVLKNGVLINYPTFGTNYATLKIDSIGVSLPVYYGATYDILKNGIAHDDFSYFPGEGGSVIMAGHNFKSYLANLPKAQIGDEIVVEASYGTFRYKISEQKIIKEEDTDQVPIQDEEEILMLYTCWPINNIGHASERYIVYANLIEEE